MLVFGGRSVLLLVVPAGRAAAQQPAEPKPERVLGEVEEIVERSGILDALEAIATEAAPELERTLAQLTGTLSALAVRIANDPELRDSAARAAHGLVGAAETVLTEQSELLRDALREAAERIESLAAPRDPDSETR
jgi:ABC-type transporter Mla subunit MlaD